VELLQVEGSTQRDNPCVNYRRLVQDLPNSVKALEGAAFVMYRSDAVLWMWFEG